MKNIADELKKLDERLEKFEKDFFVGIQIEKNAKDQKYALGSAIAKMAAAPVCFIPFVGPIVGTVLSGVAAYISPNSSSFNLGADVFAAVNRADINNFSMNNVINPLLALMSGGFDKSNNPKNSYLSESVGRLVWIYGDSIDAVANLYKTGLQVGNFQQAIKLIGKLDAATTAEKYQIAIEENVKQTTKSMLNDRATFLPLIFWKLCDSKDIKGHGTTLMNSLDLREDKDFEKWVKVTDAKSMLSGSDIDTKVLSDFARQTWGSKYRGLAKQDFQGIETYREIFKDNEDRAVTPIYIEKLRLFAYRQRFSESLKRDIESNFLKLIKQYDKKYDSSEKLFDENFYADKINKMHDCTSLTISSLSITSGDQFRRRIVYSWYCFHQILQIHLGTFIISSLPTLGIDAAADVRVMFAIIDATSTAWWATTRAFNASKRIDAKSLDPSFRIQPKTLLKLPYIGKYFDPVNIFYNYLIQFPEYQENYEEANKHLQNSIENIKIKLIKISINELMPGNNNNYIENLRDIFIKDYIDLYSNLLTKENYDKAINNINKITNKTGISSYNKDFSQRYDQILNKNPIPSSSPNEDLKTKYSKLITPDHNPISFDDNELIENIVNMHMGSLVNADSPNEFTQAEFNRSVVRAFKSLIKYINKKGSL
ncbi:hypothetical protein CGC45_03585 [Francisella opportunistica]|uniref:Uncharacterized protein n=2 Tax=Francisella opportunistica TaxID=2016517 RepID=A0A345JQY2_9GAMM|nr:MULTISPECIES: hypothetical protein [Francisella]AXH29728.1 hypothetical protein CGC43_03600 [Francisella opportunistica]AXH31378.1 hypothetical protein CGC44_03565 [Francisella opportunistica]AXH33023.1 hypothetical protein CGC45_03585 [Francisella opportunistica]